MNLTFLCDEATIEATNTLGYFKWVWSGMQEHAQSEAKW